MDLPKKVLVIEDNKADFWLIRSCLNKYFPSASFLHSYYLSGGIEIISSESPDIIFLDLSLPDSFGLETIKTAGLHCNDIPIIVLTGNEDIEFGASALKYGASDYLFKSQMTEDSLYKSVLYALERKKGERSLKNNIEFYRVLFRNNQSITLLIDPNDARIVDANTAACSYYGYKPEQIRQKTVSDISITPQEVIAKLLPLAMNRQITNFPFKHRLANGEIRDVEATSEPIHINGQLFLYIVVVDITEKNRIADETHYRQRLSERTNQLLRDCIRLVVKKEKGLSELLDIITREIIRVLSVDDVQVSFVSPASGNKHSGEDTDPKPSSFLEDARQFFNDYGIISNIVSITNTAEIEDEFRCFEKYLLPHGISSALIIPMFNDKKFIGCITCSNKKTRRWWKEEEAFFLSLTDTIAIARLNELQKTDRRKLRLKVKRSQSELDHLNSQLSESLDIQKTIFDSIPHMAWMKNCDGRYIAVNREFLQSCEKSWGEVIGKTDFDIWEYESAQIYRQNDLRVIAEKREIRTEERGGRSRGNLYETRKVPIISKSGTVLGTVGISHDITIFKKDSDDLKKEKKELERLVNERTRDLQEIADALREEIKDRIKIEDQLKQLSVAVEQSPISTVITDTEGRIQYINPKFSEISGYSQGEVIGKDPGILKSGHTPEEVYRDLWEKLRNGEQWSGEIINKKKSGEYFWEHVIISPIKDNVGVITHYIGLKQDITERKRNEKTLRDSEERFRTIFENSPLGIRISIDEKIVYINKAFVKILGYKHSSEVLGRSILEFTDPSQRAELKNYMKRKIDGETVEDPLYYNIRRRDGTTFYNKANISEIQLPEGRALVSFNRDISQEKLKEEQILNSLREKEVLLKEIHHRVKNNLQIISSLLNLQAHRFSDPLLSDVFSVSQNRIKAMALIHEKLYHSKNLSVINFSDYVTDLTAHLNQIYMPGGQRVELTIDIDPVFLSIDTAVPCGLIINELISNALKYAFINRDGGCIKISGKKIGTHRVNLTISDNGNGFPDDYDFSDTDTLGLQLVRNLVDQIDGRLEVENNNGVKYSIMFHLGAGEISG